MHTPTFIADWQIVDGCMIIYFIFFQWCVERSSDDQCSQVWTLMASRVCLLATSSTSALVTSGKRSQRTGWNPGGPVGYGRPWWAMVGHGRPWWSCWIAKRFQTHIDHILITYWSHIDHILITLSVWKDKEVSLLMKNDIITELEGLILGQVLRRSHMRGHGVSWSPWSFLIQPI